MSSFKPNHNSEWKKRLETVRSVLLKDDFDMSTLFDALSDISTNVSETYSQPSFKRKPIEKQRYLNKGLYDPYTILDEIVFSLPLPEKKDLLPARQFQFWRSIDVRSAIRSFLDQYFYIYDSEDKLPLMDAYEENALFSLTSNMFNTDRYGEHWSIGFDTVYLSRLLECGPIKQKRKYIVELFNSAPRSKHFQHAFTVDQLVHSPSMTLVTVSGLFIEFPAKIKIMFSKTMVLIRSNLGYRIRQEILVLNDTEWDYEDDTCACTCDHKEMDDTSMDDTGSK